MRPSSPRPVQVAEVARGIGVEVRTLGAPGTAQPPVVTGVELRAQDVQPGDLYAALPGAHRHGAEFVADAIANGATAVLTDSAGADLVSWTWDSAPQSGPLALLVHDAPRTVLGEASAIVAGRPSEHMQVIGITGTSGKTTTSYLLDAALRAGGATTAVIGTVETRIGDEVLPSSLTTPEAPHLHALFALMLERGVSTVVMEVSSHALALGRVDGVRFALGGFTNLSRDHLDFHHDFDDYFAAKARLFAAGSPVRAARAVVCVDDAWGRRMAEVARVDRDADDVRTVTTGPGEADWHATAGTTNPGGGQDFTVHTGDGAVPVALALPGTFNIANATLALALADAAGVPAAVGAPGLAQVQVPGRLQRIDRGQPFLAVVDYAHKPGALEAVIATLRAQYPGRLAVVVGAGGDRDREKRAEMGAVAAQSADLLVVTDDNPRTEDPAAIRAQVLAGARSAPKPRAVVEELGDRRAAIRRAIGWARPGDVVLIAGKGHEKGQEISGVKHPFDDRDETAAALTDRLSGDAANRSGDGEAHA